MSHITKKSEEFLYNYLIASSKYFTSLQNLASFHRLRVQGYDSEKQIFPVAQIS